MSDISVSEQAAASIGQAVLGLVSAEALGGSSRHRVGDVDGKRNMTLVCVSQKCNQPWTSGTDK